MTAPTVPDQATDLEEQLEREVPCDVDAIGPLREDDAGHGPAHWLLLCDPCPTTQHTRGGFPLCDECAAWVRMFMAHVGSFRCPVCGRCGWPSDFMTLKEL